MPSDSCTYSLSGDGELDLREQDLLLRRLLPMLDSPIKDLNRQGRYEEAAVLAEHLTMLKEQMKQNELLHATRMCKQQQGKLKEV